MSYQQDGLQTVHHATFMSDPRFQRAYARGVRAAGSDYLWHWRVHVGLWAAQLALEARGDFVECGTNRGFMASAIMEGLGWNAQDRQFWLLDTFSGVDPGLALPEEIDSGSLERANRELQYGVYTTDSGAVVENFREWSGVQIIKGRVPDTLAQIDTDHIAFLHLDMNCARPEYEAFMRLWPRLTRSAVILMDDYCYQGYESQGTWLNRAAQNCRTSILALPTGQGLVVKTNA